MEANGSVKSGENQEFLLLEALGSATLSKARIRNSISGLHHFRANGPTDFQVTGGLRFGVILSLIILLRKTCCRNINLLAISPVGIPIILKRDVFLCLSFDYFWETQKSNVKIQHDFRVYKNIRLLSCPLDEP